MIDQSYFEALILFWIYGAVGLVLTNFIIIGVVFFKFLNFNDLDKKEFYAFSVIQKEYIKIFNLNHLVFYRILLNIVMPMFQTYVNLIYLYHLFTKKGLLSVIIGKIKSNAFHIIPIVKYKIKYNSM